MTLWQSEVDRSTRTANDLSHPDVWRCIRILLTMFARRLLRTTPFRSLPTPLCGRRSQTPFLRMASTLPKLPIFEAIAGHKPGSTAVIHSSSGRRFTYGQLLKDTADARHKLYKVADSGRIAGERIAFLAESGYDYVGARSTAPRSCKRIPLLKSL